MIIFDVERMEDPLMDEMEGLWKDHWEQVAQYKEYIKLKVDREWYKLMQDSGLYLMVTAREEGALIGYAGFLIAPHPHYADNIFCNMDVAFLAKEKRKSFAGINLFKFAEKELKELDVDILILRTKEHYNLGPIFERLGYKRSEVAYSKYIGE